MKFISADEVYIIYADILFAVNFCLDFLCLYLTGALLRQKLSAPRIIAGAASGGLYSVLAVKLYGGEGFWYYFGFACLHFAFAVLITFIAFGAKKLGSALKQGAAFMLCCACAGGILFAFFTLAGKYAFLNGGFYSEVPATALIIVGFAAAAGTFIFWLLSSRRLKTATAEITVKLDGKDYFLSLLCDSGNLLREPLSGLPVIIVRDGALTFKDRPMRVVPFNTPAGKDLLFAYKPDKILLHKKGKTKELSAYIAPCKSACDFGNSDGIISAFAL